jgi:hypothetical protein
VDAREALGTISAPTLVVHRSDDPVTPLEHGRYLADHIRGARMAVFPGAFHFSGVGNDEDALDEIEQFLTGTRAEHEIDRVLNAVLFTGIAGSTERAVQMGDRRWHELLATHDSSAAMSNCSQSCRDPRAGGRSLARGWQFPGARAGMRPRRQRECGGIGRDRARFG